MVAAHRRESSAHGVAHAWLLDAIAGHERVGVPAESLVGFVRLVTNPRVFRTPTSPESALRFLEALTAASVSLVPAGPGFFARFRTLVARTRARGGAVVDAALAAVALDVEATWVTFDEGFRVYPGLEWLNPATQERFRNPP